MANAQGFRQHNFRVAQSKSLLSIGYLLTFLPVNSGDEAVRVSTDLNIVFRPMDTICTMTSMVWRLSNDESTIEWAKWRYVTAGGVTRNPSVDTWRNQFKMEEYEGHYMLMFCPIVCTFCSTCEDLAIFVEDGKIWLGLRLNDAYAPFLVKFRRVD